MQHLCLMDKRRFIFLNKIRLQISLRGDIKVSHSKLHLSLLEMLNITKHQPILCKQKEFYNLLLPNPADYSTIWHDLVKEKKKTIAISSGRYFLPFFTYFLFSVVIYLDLFHATAFCHGVSLTLFTQHLRPSRYDTRSIFKRSLTGLNSEFSFS